MTPLSALRYPPNTHHPPPPPQVVSLEGMRALVAGAAAAGPGGAQIADARPAGRFAGADPEPRPGLRRGHMPGARSLPFTEVGAV